MFSYFRKPINFNIPIFQSHMIIHDYEYQATRLILEVTDTLHYATRNG